MKRSAESRSTRRCGAWSGFVKTVGAILWLSSLPMAVNAQALPGALPESAAALSRGEWPAYAGTYAAARYSPLVQIDRENAGKLRVVWRWKSPDHAVKDGNPRVGPTQRTNPHR